MTTVKAYAKINWAIDILGVRADGLHTLDSLMETVSLHDALTFENAKDMRLTVDGIAVAVDDDNLILRAAHALNQATGQTNGAHITLRKQIPVQAGLGGGSADAAATLHTLNSLWGLALSEDALMELGYRLGCDVPYMLTCGLARVGGAGETVRRVPAARTLDILIVKPEKGLSTGDVYRAWDRSGRTLGLDMDELEHALVAGDMERVRCLSGNALEDAAQTLLPEIASIERKLCACGALFVRMSGSGSAVFGVFDSEKDARDAQKSIGVTSFVTKTI